MCNPAAIGLISVVASTASTIYSTQESKKAEKRQIAAQQELARQSKQPANTISDTAKTATVNEPSQKRTLSSLRIPSSTRTTPTVNTGEISTGLNIPM